jgi:hypothetical protein
LDSAYLIRILAFVGAYYLRIMSQLQIETVCIQCQKHFLSKKKGSRFCSNVCRAQYSRDGRLSKLKSQSKVIKTQSKIIESILPVSNGPAAISEVKQNGYQRNYDQIQDIIRKVNLMTKEAKEAAIAAGQFKERWSGYLKDSAEFQRLLRSMSQLMD